MAQTTVQGIYRNGHVELIEQPIGVGEGDPVEVTFVGTAKAPDEAARQARLEAGQRLMALLDQGIPLGGPPNPKREELYDRVDRLSDRLGQGDR